MYRGRRSGSSSRPEAPSPPNGSSSRAPSPSTAIETNSDALATSAPGAGIMAGPPTSVLPVPEPRSSSLPTQASTLATSSASVTAPITSPLRTMFPPPTPAKETYSASFGAASDSDAELSSSPPGIGVYHPIAFEQTAAARGVASASTSAPQPTGVPLVTTRTASPTSPDPPTVMLPAQRPSGQRTGSSSRRAYHSPRPSGASRPSTSIATDQSSQSQASAYVRSVSPYSPGLGQHLFESGLLNSQLSDVNILCFGRIYRLHRLVLAQVDFFAQLLDGDWREAASGSGRKAGDDCIRLVFDQNVTRASWEFCIATIYGGGPEIAPAPWSKVEGEPLLLGRTFALLQKRVLASAEADRVNENEEHGEWTRFLPSHSPLRAGLPFPHTPPTPAQPATPTFLLSLLACASYLGMTPLVSSTIALIQDTLTPFTVLTYLDFAQGRGIRMSQEERESPCRMLEEISVLATSDTPTTAVLSACTDSPSRRPVDLPSDEPDGDGSHCVKESSTDDGASQAPSMADSVTSLFYGPPAERVGEACACWLAKWGGDVLAVEEALHQQNRESAFDISEDDGLEAGAQETAVVEMMPWLARPRLALWGLNGMDGKWVRGLVSSDAFFLGRDVRGVGDGADIVGTGGEWERYGFAKRVAELRQGQAKLRGKKPSDPELGRLFEEGIYYSHMGFKELATIASDRSTVTGRPHVSTARLHRAHWDATEFRHSIPQALPSSTSALGLSMPSSPSVQSFSSHPVEEVPLELGFAKALAPSEEAAAEQAKPFYVVPVDRTCRLNDAALGGAEYHSASPASGPLTNRIYIDSDSFFGLGREVIRGSLDYSRGVIVSANNLDAPVGNEPDVREKRRFNIYEPCRFSVEFFDVQQLKEKQRVYSHSHFYGGSLFNCYLQVVRNQKRSSLQLGLYLHRQSMLEAPPVPSRPSWAPQTASEQTPLVGTHSLFGEGSRLRSALTGATPPTQNSMPPFMGLNGGAQALGAGSPNQARAPYVDRRKAVQAYFAVHSPTLRGTAATLFASGPDAFANSQSWGYRSSSLLSPEYIGTGASALGGTAGKATVKGTPGRYSSLRCTVTIGLS